MRSFWEGRVCAAASSLVGAAGNWSISALCRLTALLIAGSSMSF
ncbi:Uncharacterised protein [Mycobacteroides abscessus subsp. abscessus]|nr:Uncharacterised protein [Mycobacteroides abscessus subsp. abscessus]